MAEKIIRLFVLRSDLKDWDGGPVELEVRDLSKGIQVLRRKTLQKGSNSVQIETDVFFDAGQLYAVSVDAPGHRSAYQFIDRKSFDRLEGNQKVEGKEVIVRLMLVPEHPSSSNLEAGYQRLVDNASPLVTKPPGLSEDAYRALGPKEKMALLNLNAKLRNTRLNGVPLISYVEGLRYVGDDRIFVYVRSELKKMVDESSDFASAKGHGVPANTPIPLPAHPQSWKHTLFGAGNLQLSFTKTSESIGEGAEKRQVFSADADIDLERGLGHVFEFLKNKFNQGENTDQTLVYALLYSQGIIPYYTLDPLPSGVV
jgi:hypothetical protein